MHGRTSASMTRAGPEIRVAQPLFQAAPRGIMACVHGIQAFLGRVEEQVTVFRLRHTSVTEFPRCGSLAACHALRPTPPSSDRTCSFPASGSPGNSRLRHSQGVARFKLFTDTPIPYGPGAHKAFSLPMDGRAAGSAVLGGRPSDSVQTC